MLFLKACGGFILALSIATASIAAEGSVHKKHHGRMSRSAHPAGAIAASDPDFPVGFISNGFDSPDALSGDDAYGPPRGFHGGLYRGGVVQPGPGGPFDRVSGCGSSFSC